MTLKKLAEHEAWHAVLWIRIGCKVNSIEVRHSEFEQFGVTKPDRLVLNYVQNPPQKYSYNAFANLGVCAPHVIATLVGYVVTFSAQKVDHWNSEESDVIVSIKYLCDHYKIDFDLEKNNKTSAFRDWGMYFEECKKLAVDGNYVEIVNALVPELLVHNIIFWDKIEEIVYPYFKKNNWAWVLR